MSPYTALLENCFSQQLKETPAPTLPDELTLQALWFNGQFGTTFQDTEGNTVTIKQFGFWNRTAGPDFLHASIERNGIVSSGPLELDTHTHDWEQHGHANNPAFNQVILHVVFRDASHTHSFTRTSDHRCVPRIIIPENRIHAALLAPAHQQATAHKGRCFFPLEELSTATLHQLLRNAARYRCTLKAKRLLRIKDAHGEDQALWIALAETLGYRPNKQAMSLLAQRAPIHFLSQHTTMSDSLLFGIAGFLHPHIYENAPIDSQQWLQTMWEDWWKVRDQYELSPPRSIPWIYSGIRPINHPQRRLATLSLIAQHWSTFKKLSKQPSTLQEWLETLSHPFWSHHYTLTSKRSEKRLALVGKDRITDLLLNHLLPLQIDSNHTAAWELYQTLKAPALSESIKRVSTRLLGDRTDKKEFLRFAWQHQGLLQIYHDFCLKDVSDCEDCPFPEQLSQL